MKLGIVKREGISKILEHLSKLVGSPFLNRTHGWNSSSFDLKRIFEYEPPDVTSIFLDHKLKRCKSPDDQSKDILCLKFDYSWVNTNFSGQDMAELLLDMNEAYLIKENEKLQLKAQIDDAVERVRIFNDLKVIKHFHRFYNFLNFKFQESQRNNFSVFSQQLMTVNELSALTKDLSLNWLTIINNQLLNSSKITEDDLILVDNPELLNAISKKISEADNAYDYLK